jgi:hypothetical protein
VSRRVLLREVAHARAGDKGNRSNVAVYVYEQRHYAALAAQLTPERLRAEFPQLLRGRIERFELEQLGALNFVMDDALEGGVNESLNLDSHGKSWSFLLLGLEVEIEDQVGTTASARHR